MTAPRLLQILIRRELRRFWRNQSEAVQPFIFFSLTVLLFPFAIGSNSALLGAAAPGILWVAVLLSLSLSLDPLFRSDQLDGSLDFLIVSGISLPVLALGKALSHWLLNGLPLVLLTAPFGFALNLEQETLRALLLSLVPGSCYMSLIGTAVTALTAGLRNSGMLLVLLMLPLYIPVLIFGSAAASNAALGLPVTAELYFIAGMFVLALTLTPWATAAAIKVRMN